MFVERQLLSIYFLSFLTFVVIAVNFLKISTVK